MCSLSCNLLSRGSTTPQQQLSPKLCLKYLSAQPAFYKIFSSRLLGCSDFHMLICSLFFFPSGFDVWGKCSNDPTAKKSGCCRLLIIVYSSEIRYKKFKLCKITCRGLCSCCFFSYIYSHSWGASVKPDNLGNQRGIQIAAIFGSPDILYFFTTHFWVGTLREPALYHGEIINAGT